MPETARRHFDEDIARARAILAEALALPATKTALAADLRRAGVAFGVGAMDAYLCDAYVDCLTRCMRAYREGRCTKFPSDYAKELLPAGPMLATHYTQRASWALRMAARGRMDKANLLQVSRVRDMMNPVLPQGQKLWVDIIDLYTALGRRRLTKFRAAEISALAANQRQNAREQAARALIGRIGTIVQRRHDIVHNVDRPKNAAQVLTKTAATGMLNDVADFIQILDAHIDAHRRW